MAFTAERPAGDPHADPMVPRIGRVKKRVRDLSDVWTLTIEMDEPFAFGPGQFNMLYVFGTGEVPISISGNPARSVGQPTRVTSGVPPIVRIPPRVRITSDSCSRAIAGLSIAATTVGCGRD